MLRPHISEMEQWKGTLTLDAAQKIPQIAVCQGLIHIKEGAQENFVANHLHNQLSPMKKIKLPEYELM